MAFSARWRKHGPRTHGGEAREHLDKAALVIAFLAGVAGTLAMKLLDVPPLWVAGWSALVLVVYALATWMIGQLRIEPESIGDNCYYLGFLLTLTSLAVTLYQLADATDQGVGQAGALRAIISGFGVALSSTIVGVALRVLMMQMRPDIVARDREARIELAQAAREFRSELGLSVATLKEFSLEANQLAAEQGSKIAALAEQMVNAQRMRLESDADLYAQTLRKVLEDASGQVARSLTASLKASSKSAQAEVTQALEALSRSVAELVSAQSAALAAQGARDAAHSATAGAALARTTAIAEDLDVLAGRIGTAVATISADLADGATALATARRAIEVELQGALAAYRAESEKVTETAQSSQAAESRSTKNTPDAASSQPRRLWGRGIRQ